MTRSRRLSTRRRLLARILPALVLVWAIGGLILYAVVQGGLTAEIDSDLRGTARRGAAVLENLDLAPIDDTSENLPASDSATAVIHYREDGFVTAVASGSDDRPDPLPDLRRHPLVVLRANAGEPFTVPDLAGEDQGYRAIAVVLDDGSVIVSARSLDHTNHVLHQLRRIVLIALLVSFTAVIGLVWTVSRWTLRPLERVAETAQQISTGTLSSAVEPASPAADVESLAGSINTMLSRLREAFTAKERSEASLRQFVADASHELRTPLAAIIGYADLHHQNIAQRPDQVDHIFTRISAEGARMESLLEDLLLLARLDQGRPLAEDAVDLRWIIEDAISAATTIDPDRSYSLTIETHETGVLGDAIALRQVIDNLLSNVRMHTPTGTTAQVTVASDDTHVVITVVDDGPGMTEEQRSHAFDRFWRAEESRSRPGGHGLGLAIVADLVRAQNGDITVDRGPAGGCTFRAQFPRAVGEPSSPRST